MIHFTTWWCVVKAEIYDNVNDRLIIFTVVIEVCVVFTINHYGLLNFCV